MGPDGNRSAAAALAVCLGALVLAVPGAGRAETDPQAHDPLPPPLVASPEEIGSPASGPTAAPMASSAAITFEERVLEIVNEERLANGSLPPLKGVSQLFASSETHSFNMADEDFFAHCDHNGHQAWDRMTAAGYFWNVAAENIAAGFGSPESVMEGWMASPGHRANILSTTPREIGVGYYEQGNDMANVRLDQNGDCTFDNFGNGPFLRYWTQNFGRRNSVFPLVIERERHDTVCAGVELYVYGPPGADQMQFSNDGVSYSPLEPFANHKTWTLTGSASSETTVYVRVHDGPTTYEASDTIYLGPDFPAPSHLDLPPQTVSSTETHVACDTITAPEPAGDFTVSSTGDLTLHAGNRVILEDGFSVESGGSLTVIVGGL